MNVPYRFNDKEILVDGIPIEEVPIRKMAVHWDDDVLKTVCHAIIFQAIIDWKELEKVDKTKKRFRKKTYNDKRNELKDFFRGSYCGEMLRYLVSPYIDQEEAIKHMDKYYIEKSSFSLGRGRRGETAKKRSEARKESRCR